MSDSSFSPGMNVHLNSGGHMMTVESANADGTVTCVWFKDDELKRETFNPSILVEVAAPGGKESEEETTTPISDRLTHYNR